MLLVSSILLGTSGALMSSEMRIGAVILGIVGGGGAICGLEMGVSEPLGVVLEVLFFFL